jgi:hypothetical protein
MRPTNKCQRGGCIEYQWRGQLLRTGAPHGKMCNSPSPDPPQLLGTSEVVKTRIVYTNLVARFIFELTKATHCTSCHLVIRSISTASSKL